MIYTLLDVWRRVDDNSAQRYRCFKNASTGQACVQNVDTIRLPFDGRAIASQDRYFFELFIEQAPEERAEGWSDSVEEAVQNFDKKFADTEPASGQAENSQ